MSFEHQANARLDREAQHAHTISQDKVVKEGVQSKPSNPKDMVGVRKAPMSTVSAVVMAEIGVAMLEGATKYGRHNYRVVGVRASVYYDALMRHMQAWWEGEDIDADSGMSHIVKAITTLVVLRDAMIMNNVEDDRPPAPPGFYEVLNEVAGKIIDRNARLSPHHYTQKEMRDDALGATGPDR